MSFLSHKSATHGHLLRRVGNHSGLHTVTTGKKPDAEAETEQPKPFGELKFDDSKPSEGRSAYKPILGI